MVLRGPSGASWGALERLLGRSWALLGRAWGALGSSWGYLGRSWGAFGTLLGALWRHLERSCGALGRFWTFLDDLDSILEPPRVDFGVSGGRFQASSRAREPSRRQANVATSRLESQAVRFASAANIETRKPFDVLKLNLKLDLKLYL